MQLNFIALLVTLFALSWAEENYYDVLGVAKDASTKDIRKAFKKLALKLHPDKNTGDPEAHNKFVRINGIYEVLKDSETREKYDKYGEEGLKEGFNGGRYESYQYYRDEFGIYDDDPEVVTLDGGDFEAAVNSGEAWFVNFYSPRCSHCHELAPTWRKFAEEMSGAAGIGAVNCRDNMWICQNNGIYSYPSLVMFVRGKRPMKYQGSRTKKDLIKFVMQYVTVKVLDLWDKNWKSELSANDNQLPYVVSVCMGEDGEGDCPSENGARKLAGLLNGVANVATVDCDDSPKLCKLARLTEGQKSGFYYYPVDTFPTFDFQNADVSSAEQNQQMASHHRFDTLDAREIKDFFMKKFMSGIKTFSLSKLQAFVNKKPLLAFIKFNSETEDVDENETSLKKLPALLKKDGVSVCKVVCDDWCKKNLQLDSDCTVAFKGKGHNQFEVFHGRMKTSELASFAVESVRSQVTTLNPSYFDLKENLPVDQDKPWFIDFFAPWCPPCKQFLPELRKSSNRFPSINFGSVDCVLHKSICQSFGIRSYPTSYVFNGTKMSEFEGHLDEHSVAQYINDLINPPFVELDSDKFGDLVHDRKVGESWAVAFVMNHQQPSRQLLHEWKKAAKMLENSVNIGVMNCQGDSTTYCKLQGVSQWPTLRIYPAKASPNSKPLYIPYQGYRRQASRLVSWVMDSISNKVIKMDQSYFNGRGALKSKSAWVVDYYANWCGPCHAFMPRFMLTAMKHKDERVKWGKIDCEPHKQICGNSGVRAYPTLVFYPPGDTTYKQQHKQFIQSQDPAEIVMLVDKYMKRYSQNEKPAHTEF